MRHVGQAARHFIIKIKKPGIHLAFFLWSSREFDFRCGPHHLQINVQSRGMLSPGIPSSWLTGSSHICHHT